MEQWRYYNHALVSTAAPHEAIIVSNAGGVLKNNKKALFIKWTTDFDHDGELNWYYVIREKPYIFEELSRSAKSDIRRSLKKCYVKKIDPEDYLEDMHRISIEARKRYTNSDHAPSFEINSQFWIKRKNEGRDFFMGFESETNRAIGYVTCMNYGSYVNFEGAKYSTDYLKLRISDALNSTILDYYLNECGCKYVCDGERSIFHETNFQDYLIKTFGYRKAYCHLHIIYRSWFGLILKVLFPVRKILYKFDNNLLIHKVNAVLKLEEIRRGEKNGFEKLTE